MPGDFHAFDRGVAALRSLTPDLRQLASVTRIMLDEGAERGVSALAFSTGGGLDFSILVDRSLDIGQLSWRGMPVAWRSPAGFMHPSLIDRDAEGGRGFERGFSGMLVTCGLDHIRQPRDGRPLHGRLPFTPARLHGYGEDWSAQTPFLFCEGEVRQWRIGAESFRLTRRVEAPIGGSRIVISDRVENFGASAAPHAILYHVNFGYPAIDLGSVVRLDGDAVLGPISMPDASPIEEAFTRPCGKPTAICTLTTPRSDEDFVAELRFPSSTLPHLQMWRDLRPGVGVLSVEPCTSAKPVEGVAEEMTLGPGESRRYELSLSFGSRARAAQREAARR